MNWPAGARYLARAALVLALPTMIAMGYRVSAGDDGVPRRVVIEIKGLVFTPERAVVQVGDTVVWINRDLVPHTATASSRSGWEVGPISEGEEGFRVVAVAGSFRYFCRFHPTMTGVLVVR